MEDEDIRNNFESDNEESEEWSENIVESDNNDEDESENSCSSMNIE